jgi:hypothetical protein
MLALLSRKRAHKVSRTRSVNCESDLARVDLVSRSIEWSLRAAQAEQAGLIQRLEEIMARALIPLGNGTDEYLTRDAVDNRRLDRLEQEILKSESRLQQLANQIAHFKFLGTALTARFPDFRPSSESN